MRMHEDEIIQEFLVILLRHKTRADLDQLKPAYFRKIYKNTGIDFIRKQQRITGTPEKNKADYKFPTSFRIAHDSAEQQSQRKELVAEVMKVVFSLPNPARMFLLADRYGLAMKDDHQHRQLIEFLRDRSHKSPKEIENRLKSVRSTRQTDLVAELFYPDKPKKIRLDNYRKQVKRAKDRLKNELKSIGITGETP